MKKYLNAVWMLLLLAMIAVSCGGGDNVEPETIVPPKLNLDSESQLVVSDQSNQTVISFTVNQNWTASSNQSWCHLDKTSGGPGNISIAATLDKNETYDSREATISVSSGSAKVSVRVTQAQKDAIVLAKSEYTIDSDETELEFEIQTNVSFSVSTNVDWIKYDPSKSRALETKKLDFIVTENTVEKQREGEITIQKDDIKQVVKVIQEAMIPQEVSITHHLKTFIAPLFGGKDVAQWINWGEGENEPYAVDAQHTYAGEGNHTVTIRLQDAEEITLKSVEGVTQIDLSKF